MVVETLWPDSAPWWLNLFIWMATFYVYLFAGFIPAFYICVVKLFGFPLLQRWQQEVVIMLYPNKVRFCKVTDETDPYFRKGKGLYWRRAALVPEEVEGVSPRYQARLDKIKKRYEELATKETRTDKESKEIEKILKEQAFIEKRKWVINPVNQIHVYSHAVNQAVYDPVRIRTKGDDLLTAESKPKQIKGHGVWLMQNPKLHFHRHYLLVVNHDRTSYRLLPVKQRQQFSIGFWHSIGVSLENFEQVKVEGSEELSSSVASGKQQAVLIPVTTNMVLKQIKQVQAYQNFSASQAYRILKRRAKIDENYEYWITGSTNPMIFMVLIGGVAAIALVMFFLHGNSSAVPTTPTGPKSMFGL